MRYSAAVINQDLARLVAGGVRNKPIEERNASGAYTVYSLWIIIVENAQSAAGVAIACVANQ